MKLMASLEDEARTEVFILNLKVRYVSDLISFLLESARRMSK